MASFLQLSLAILLLGLELSAGASLAAEPPPGLRAAADCFARGEYARAREFAAAALNSGTDAAEAWSLLAACSSAQGDHQTAIGEYDALLKVRQSASAYNLRGAQKFMIGQIEQSIADFDRAIELQPSLEKGHWQRGISYYYAGRWADGQKQFEGYQQIDASDVENAVWRYLCMARGQNLEKARQDILHIRHDGRVPMMQIYALYSGQGTEQAVVEATRAGNPAPAELNARQFYAELYLGLYAEATGDREAARRHIRAAAEDHKIAHYMWDVARVHADLLARTDAADAKP